MLLSRKNCRYWVGGLSVAFLLSLSVSGVAQEVDGLLQKKTPVANQVPSLQAVSPQEPVSPANSLRSGQELNEIMDLRRSMGGGVSSILGDLGSGNSEEGLQQDFEAELARLMEQGEAGKAPVLQGPVPTLAVQESMVLPPITNRPTPHAKEKVAAIRRVSRQLEALAWDLEEIDAYGEADRLRQQASDLRQQARDMQRR